jgi:transcriptional regulator with XRE-family HTH domain
MIAASLAVAIKASGITQSEIARELNVSGAWVSLRLTGKAGSLADLEAIAGVVGLAPTWSPVEPVECWHDREILRGAP